MDFKSRYNNLNKNQQSAVDTIDGPVMVVAGPGTGKTELLGMRTANILTKTDTLPENILCLTFTESGADAMRKRLADIIGKDAYKVAIHTFHSFGSEIINQYAEYFYQGASFRPADDLTTYQIIKDILDELDYTNPLTSKMNGEYTYIRDLISSISDLKRSGLMSDELIKIIDAGDAVMDAVEQDLAVVFSRRISATTLAQVTPIAHKIATLTEPPLPAGITPLSSVLALSLAHAIDTATETDSTKPITAWKNKWLTKNSQGEFVFKDRARHEKLRAASFVYFQYLMRMQKAELYDYDDMILRVVHALELFNDLRFNLQEKYQYIMVDEFQDTNLAQMRILSNLTNNPAHGDTPNIMVVGDDDQAIFSFQGADISNILSFRSLYPQTKLVTLTDNYRSGESILTTARQIITQGSDRLENHIDEVDKTLTAHKSTAAKVSLYEAETLDQERQWLVDNIAKQIQQGTPASQITVLARRHHEIISLLPYFNDQKIAVNYERRDNVFETKPIQIILQTARIITLLSQQQIDQADRMLPELMSHPAWGFTPDELWQLSLKAYDSRRRWLDTMETLPVFVDFHQWLIGLATTTLTEPLEPMIDTIIGAVDNDNYKSPLYDYFFSPQQLADDPETYVRHLEALRTIRAALKDHNPDQNLSLESLVQFSDLYQQTGSTLTSVQRATQATTQAVNLMTAHKSKGLEFNTVYITGAVETAWGERVRSKNRLIGYPENLPLATAGDTSDERLRLFFVATTRAKQELFISYATADDNNKPLQRANFLLNLEPQTINAKPSSDTKNQTATSWYSRLIPSKTVELSQILAPTIESYKLSATHLGNFLDVTRGGPQSFLIHNLLRFPQAMSPAAAYGSAIHAALQRAHAHLAATKKPRAIEDIIGDFTTELTSHRLAQKDLDLFTQKGADSLQAFLSARYDTFTTTQKVELNFASQQSIIGDAHLTGKLDLVDIDDINKTIVVTDYKTGQPARDWKGKADYEKVKLHRYHQQLMFYKLLIENSRDYNQFKVERGVLQFVEPNREGDILALDDNFETANIEEFRLLVEAVWRKITTLDMPNTDHYDQSFKGILAFEQDLLDGNI